MTIYLASPFEHQAEMRTLRTILQRRYFTVNARWLDEAEIPGIAGPGDVAYQGHAVRDLEDIRLASVVVVNNPRGFERSGSGGRHVELGYALALGKTVLLYGKPSNVFHTLPHIQEATDLDTLIQQLRSLREAKSLVVA